MLIPDIILCREKNRNFSGEVKKIVRKSTMISINGAYDILFCAKFASIWLKTTFCLQKCAKKLFIYLTLFLTTFSPPLFLTSPVAAKFIFSYFSFSFFARHKIKYFMFVDLHKLPFIYIYVNLLSFFSVSPVFKHKEWDVRCDVRSMEEFK